MEARELLEVYACISCRDKVGHGVPISIGWHGHFYGCEHISVKDLQESGYFERGEVYDEQKNECGS